MKKIFSILIIICLILSVVGCKKLVNTEYQTVEVTITDAYRRGPRKVGATVTSSRYRIKVEYNNEEYIVNGRDIYYKYKDKIGQKTMGTLKILTYDDNSVVYKISELK